MSGPAPAPTNRRTAGLLAVEPSRPSDRVVRGVPSAPDRIRTCDLRFRRPTLYPAELRARGWACDGTPRRPMLAVLRPRAGPAGSLPTMPDEGYFPRGRSVLRRVHRERVVGYLYGQRALLMQATHPVAFAGLTANTSGLDAPFQRLAHTAKTMEAVFFGTRAGADRETARVRALHARVRGNLEERAGPH